MSELGHKAHFLLDFIPVSVVGPEEDVESDSQGLPDQLDRAVLSIRDVLNRSQSDVKETNS